jgi:hypothetical protein
MLKKYTIEWRNELLKDAYVCDRITDDEFNLARLCNDLQDERDMWKAKAEANDREVRYLRQLQKQAVKLGMHYKAHTNVAFLCAGLESPVPDDFEDLNETQDDSSPTSSLD